MAVPFQFQVPGFDTPVAQHGVDGAYHLSALLAVLIDVVVGEKEWHNILESSALLLYACFHVSVFCAPYLFIRDAIWYVCGCCCMRVSMLLLYACFHVSVFWLLLYVCFHAVVVCVFPRVSILAVVVCVFPCCCCMRVSVCQYFVLHIFSSGMQFGTYVYA